MFVKKSGLFLTLMAMVIVACATKGQSRQPGVNIPSGSKPPSAKIQAEKPPKPPVADRKRTESEQFRPYRRKNTLKAYLAFIKKYPDNKWVPLARLYVDELEFASYAEEGTIKSYEAFIKKHPHNRFVATAKAAMEDLVFERTKDANTIAGYADFMKNYPASPRVPEARQLEDALEFAPYKAKDTPEGYAEFINEYPSNSFQDEAVKRINALEMERVKAEAGKICDELKHAGGKYDCSFVSFVGGVMTVKFNKPDETTQGQEYLMGGPGYAEELERRYLEWRKDMQEKLGGIRGVISLEEAKGE